MKRQELLEKAKETTTSPGVYLMKDASEVVLYIGKAKNLKNRVTTYFQTARHEVLRTEVLVGQIDHFDLILTETEQEALILESTLIKKHKPKYNVRLKDDKAYPYIRIQLDHSAPRLEWTRKVSRDGARYFGPFPSAWAARQTLELLNQTFRLRDCADNTFNHRSRPCLLYQMDRCSGPCVGKISSENYLENLREAIAVLEGKGDKLLAQLQRGMEDAAKAEDYELAATYRDQLQNLRLVTETQGVLDAGSTRHRDVVAIALSKDESPQAHAVVLQVRNGKLTGVRHTTLQNADPSRGMPGILAEFLSLFYLEGDGKTKRGDPDQPFDPQEILLTEAPDDVDLLEKTLGLTFKVPENQEERQLIQVARVNAEHSLELSLKNSLKNGLQVLEGLQKKLQLAKLPVRIECYDISNFQGEDAVASRVVFIQGEADKNLYRRYKIKTVEGSNDFAMMKEVLHRRFSRKEDAFPDLVVVDGGKGQLSQAVKIFEELNVQGVEAVGLAKARTESDFQSEEVKSSFERVFIPGRANPIPLKPHMGEYKLLVQIRDEAHRFAINYHRKLRDRGVIHGKKQSH